MQTISPVTGEPKASEPRNGIVLTALATAAETQRIANLIAARCGQVTAYRAGAIPVRVVNPTDPIETTSVADWNAFGNIHQRRSETRTRFAGGRKAAGDELQPYGIANADRSPRPCAECRAAPLREGVDGIVPRGAPTRCG